MNFSQAMTIGILVKILSRWTMPLAGIVVVYAVALAPTSGLCETYGFKDEKGGFSPKVAVSVGNREILIKKTDPKDKFGTISVTLNKKNRALVNNVKFLKVQWTNLQNQPGKPLPLVGPHYDPKTLTFQEAMTRSLSLKIIDESPRDLFSGKDFTDLFALQIDDRPLTSSEAFEEKDRTVKLGAGRDISVDVNKNSILFSEENLKRGETIDVENRSEYNQTIGVELPEKGLLFEKIIRSRGQGTIPKESRDRFTVEPGSGFSIVLIPDPDPKKLASLDGSEILIKVWDGNTIRDPRRIPIQVAGEVRSAEGEGAARSGRTPTGLGASTTTPEPGDRVPRRELQPSPQTRQAEPSSRETPRDMGFAGGIWLWLLQIFNLVLLVALGVYGIFFMLPRVQVLEDRLAKNEMFIHGSREAIREELEEVKHDILRQCQKDYPPE